MKTFKACLAFSACSFLIAIAIGCQSGGDDVPATTSPGVTAPAASAGGADQNATLIAAGKAVYDSNTCSTCHAINGQGSQKAPDLSRVGANAEHTAEWIVAHVKEPRTHNPRSRMPAFGGKISDQDMLALGAYLASLK